MSETGKELYTLNLSSCTYKEFSPPHRASLPPVNNQQSTQIKDNYWTVCLENEDPEIYLTFKISTKIVLMPQVKRKITVLRDLRLEILNVYW